MKVVPVILVCLLGLAGLAQQKEWIPPHKPAGQGSPPSIAPDGIEILTKGVKAAEVGSGDVISIRHCSALLERGRIEHGFMDSPYRPRHQNSGPSYIMVFDKDLGNALVILRPYADSGLITLAQQEHPVAAPGYNSLSPTSAKRDARKAIVGSVTANFAEYVGKVHNFEVNAIALRQRKYFANAADSRLSIGYDALVTAKDVAASSTFVYHIQYLVDGSLTSWNLTKTFLSSPQSIEKIPGKNSQASFPKEVKGSDRLLFITAEGMVQAFNPVKRSFDVLHSVPLPRFSTIVYIVSGKDKYGLVLRDKQFGDWKVEIRDQKSGRLFGSVDGDQQVALVNDGDNFSIETDGVAKATEGLTGVTVARLAKRPEIPQEIRGAVRLLNKNFEPPFSLHSLTGYLAERLCRGWGTSQGRILPGGRYAVIVRNKIPNAQTPEDSTYSFVDVLTGQVFADFDERFTWSDVYVIDRFVVFAPLGASPGLIKIFNLNGNLTTKLNYAKCG